MALSDIELEDGTIERLYIHILETYGAALSKLLQPAIKPIHTTLVEAN